jgi:hypothetical protein
VKWKNVEQTKNISEFRYKKKLGEIYYNDTSKTRRERGGIGT